MLFTYKYEQKREFIFTNLTTIKRCLLPNRNKYLALAAAICLYSQYLQILNQLPILLRLPLSLYLLLSHLPLLFLHLQAPATPTGLGESFSEFGISSETSTDSETPKPKGHSRRKRVHSGYYKKGANVKRNCRSVYLLKSANLFN